MNRAMKFGVVLLLAGALAGCMSADDFGAPGTVPDQKTRDYAECELRAQEATQNGSTALIFGDLYRAALRKCMTAKGYATND